MYPTTQQYLLWLRQVVGWPPAVLPDDSPYIQWSFDFAIQTVNQALLVQPPIFALAVYNLGADRIINFAQDQPQQSVFLDMRERLGINKFYAGVVASAADTGTSGALVVPIAFQNLTLADLQELKTPYGRNYLALAQQYGPNVGGIS